MRVSIPEGCTTAYVLWSGGVDSTLLLYLLLKEKKVTNSPVDIRTFSFFGRYPYVAPLIPEIEKLFTDVKIPHYNANKRFFIREAVKFILDMEPEAYVFSGCNMVVDAFTPERYIPGDTPPVRGEPYNEHHIRPFINKDKIEIYQMVYEEGLENIIALTSSCGAPINGAECGKCYFCMEKQWGRHNANVQRNLQPNR
jgi:hypothetical protein